MPETSACDQTDIYCKGWHVRVEEVRPSHKGPIFDAIEGRPLLLAENGQSQFVHVEPLSRQREKFSRASFTLIGKGGCSTLVRERPSRRNFRKEHV